MKLVLAILGGLPLSVITFIAGLVIAAGYFSAEAEKLHLTSNEILWTDHPVRVDKACEQSLCGNVSDVGAKAALDHPSEHPGVGQNLP
jgi:hypothetical protein